MEHNVVSLNTAKKLRAAGHDVRGLAKYRLLKNGGAELHRVRGKYDVFDIPAPTAQELADHIEGHLVVSLADHRFPDSSLVWGAYLNGNQTQTGETMAEALAALWLKLKEAKS